MNIECPATDELQNWLAGELDESKSTLLAEHLVKCAKCEAAFEAMECSATAPLADLIRREPEDAFDDESPLARAIEAIANIPHNELAAEITPKSPRDIRSYRIERLIGEGGMGRVFAAHHEELDRRVAIKLLPQHLASSKDNVQRFHRECKALAALDHPNIVKAYDAGEENGVNFLAMEFVDGVDAGSLQAQIQLSPADACEIIRQAAIGLQYAHESGLVHRDIKPKNLIINRKGVVKILDLGLSLMRDVETGITSSGQLMGTVDYMAPEQAVETKSVDIRADIFSLGATLFKLLTGKTILEEKSTTVGKLSALIHEPIPQLCDVDPSQDRALGTLVDELLNHDPARRPQTPAQLAKRLAPFCERADLSSAIAKANGETVVDSRSTRRLATGGKAPNKNPVTASGRASRWRWMIQPWPLVGSLALALGLLSAGVFYFSNKDGTVRIEVSDPEIRISFAGDRVRIHDGGNRYQLSPGVHSLEIRHGKLRFRTDEFLVGKREQTRLHAVFIKGQLIVGRDGKEIWRGGAASIAALEESTKKATGSASKTVDGSTTENALEHEIAKVILEAGGEIAVNDDHDHFVRTLPDVPFQLTGVVLDEIDIDLQLLKRLTKLPHLHRLHLTSLPLQDEDLALVSKMLELRELRLINLPITDASLEHVAHLSKLQSLHLTSLNMQGTGLKHLLSIGSLNTLGLYQTRVDDEALRTVGKMHQLTNLSLQKTLITDDGIEHLKDLELRYLYVSRTSITRDGVARLNRMFTDCKVYD